MERLLYILFPGERRSRSIIGFQAAFLLFLIAWSWSYFWIPIVALGFDPGWMHNVHLVFHEAGHAITAMITDSRVPVVFMGSGLQVLFPLIVTVAFYFCNHDAYGAALGLWWTGHSTLDVAPYIGDARALQLPLISGGTGAEVEGHDWEFLLDHWDVSQHDTEIAAWVALTGRVIMVLAFLWAAGAIVYEGFFLPAQSKQNGPASG